MAIPSASQSAVWSFPAEVRFGNARAVTRAASVALDAPEPRFDLSGCVHFDSSLIGVLLELERRAGARGQQCHFESPTEKLLKLAALYGVDALLFGKAFETALTGVRASALPVR